MNGIKEHNDKQLQYFGKHIKNTMVPGYSPYIMRQIEMVVNAAQIKRGDRMLEVGCGMGRYTLAIADRGLSIEGLDLSPVLLNHLCNFAGDKRHISTYCHDIVTAPPEMDGTYDSIIGFFTLHHMADIKGCMMAVKRLLKPGGRAVFLEPNAYNPLYYLQILLSPGMTWQGDKGVMKMRKSIVLGAMRNAGMHDVALERFGFFPPSIANTKYGRLLEEAFESFKPWHALLPFQLFCCRK